MAIKIVTAKKGEPHITSADDGALHQGIFGVDDYVLNVGEKFRAELVSNNEIKIYDGEGMMQGRHWRIEPGTYESVTIDNGSQGKKRKDLIVARYTKDAGSGVENIELAVLKGTETEENAITPVPETGDLRDGDLKHEMVLYTVTLDGLNVIEVDVGFSVLVGMDELNNSLNGKSIQTGEASTENAAIWDENHIKKVKIKFPKPFRDYPVVLCNTMSSWLNIPRQTEPTEVSTSGFTAICYNEGETEYGFQWIAIG